MGLAPRAAPVKARPATLADLVCLAVLCSGTAGCGQSGPPRAEQTRSDATDSKVKALADSYLAGYFERYPDQVTYFGVTGRHHDRLPDDSLEALKAWEAREDAWHAEAKAINPTEIRNPPLRATYAIVREALEGSIGARMCHSELWNVSQQTGWHLSFGYLMTIQPVGGQTLRAEALARWRTLPRYIETEIGNLREGIRLRYLAPKQNVRIVIDQMNLLLNGDRRGSPFMSPAQRDTDSTFQRSFSALYDEQLMPAFRQYRDFLEHEYLPSARDDIAVAVNPDGTACYAALVRLYSSLSVSPRQVHERGLQQIEHLSEEMRAIAERSFHTSDVPSLLQSVRSDPQYRFKSRDDLIGYSSRALARAQTAAARWFGLLPKAAVNIEPYPTFREKSAPNEYNPPAEDGSRAGVFYISAYQAEQRNRSPAESTAFHETVPGHHLQMAIALERKAIHPIGRYIGSSGFSEGWGLYAERLADDMALYSSDLDRLGMLSSQAFRAARLVVDPGVHTMGWTRQQAIDYLLAHTAEASDDVASEVDRYVIWPGQATAYMLGMLEIRKSRDDAQRAMGQQFDIKAFHDRLLEDGAVPITFMAAKMKSWTQGKR